MQARGSAHSTASKAAGVGALAALVAVGGYGLAAVPNVEVMTLLAFSAGWLMGCGAGAAAAGIGMSLYTVLNPYGAAVPLVAAAQVVGLSTAGAAGGALARIRAGSAPGALELGVVGAAVTLVFDLSTNVATGVTLSALLPTLVAAVPFAAVHVLSNTVLFALAGPYVIRGLSAAGLGASGRMGR